MFADYIGRKPVLIAGLTTFGFAGAAVGFVTRFDAAIALRVLQGVGYAAAAPIILALLGDLYSGSRETTVQGMRVSVNSVANTLVPLLAGTLFVFSWRYPFVVYLLALPAAVWIWVTVPSIEATTNKTFRRYLSDLTSFLRDLPIALLMVSFLFRFVVFYGMITYISVLAVQEAGLAVVAVGTLLSVRSFIKTLSSTQAGRLSLSYDPAVLALGGFGMISGGTVLMGVLPTTSVLFVAIVVWGVGDGILSPSQKSLVNRMSPAEYRSGTMSTAMTFQNVGKVTGPAGLGALLGVLDPAPAFVLLGVVGGSVGVGSLVGMMVLGDP
jgi:MFS family permease